MNALIRAFRALNRGLCWAFDSLVILLGLCLAFALGAVSLVSFAAGGAVVLAGLALYHGWQFVRR